MINLQALLDAGIDAEVSGKVAAAMALDAAADAVVLKAKDDEIAADMIEIAKLRSDLDVITASRAALKAEFDAYKASHPDVTPPPPPPPPPPVDPVPPTTGWPDASNTGAKGMLTAYTGPMTITGSGVTIENKTINGTLRVTGSNFTMKNCKLTFGGWWGLDAEGAKNPTVQDCTFVGPGIAGDSNSALLISGTVLRCDISQCENGITLTNGASTVKGNYIHDLFDKSADPHYDCISVQGGQNGVLIEGNTLIGKDTSHVIICDDFGNVDNVKVNANYMGGKPGYSVYSVARHSSDKGWHVSGVSITNNTIVRPGNGRADGTNYFSIENSQTTVSGNVEAGTGKAIIS